MKGHWDHPTTEYLNSDICKNTHSLRSSFSAAGPRIWNSLPLDTKIEKFTNIFRKKLKSHLFKISYGCFHRGYSETLCHMFGIPTQPQERALHYQVQCKPWEVVGADIFMVNNKTLLCIVDLLQQVSDCEEDRQCLSRWSGTKSLSEYGLSKEIVTDAGTNFTSEAFK